MAFVCVMRWSGRFSRSLWYMFWAGVAIGATWEIGFYFVGPKFSSSPIYVTHAAFPFPTIILHLAHTLWDGGLFLAGVGLVHWLCKPPHLERFRWGELAVMIAWGQLQELVVELIGSNSALWEYQVRWYNPLLFKVNGYNITLLPQVVWLVAPVVFYLAALKINARFSTGITGLPERRPLFRPGS